MAAPSSEMVATVHTMAPTNNKISSIPIFNQKSKDSFVLLGTFNFIRETVRPRGEEKRCRQTFAVLRNVFGCDVVATMIQL